ncbi:hypothetical protein ACFT2C_06225 [Promicromonospora sp. NPDC057138]|uniref:hypothetical protein n=1 Tax=Promicromonospora sp. NPDC057138 TaxID=3346031 RepID=UPI003632666C
MSYTTRWHDTWETVGSLFTVLAVVVALGLGLIESRARGKAQADELHRLQGERDEAREERNQAERAERQRQREAQARRVVVTTVPREPIPDEGPERFQEPSFEIVVHNYSDMPVFDVLGELDRSHPGARVDGSFEYQMLPGGSASWPVYRADDPLSTEVRVEFRDAHGIIWRRRASGDLIEL